MLIIDVVVLALVAAEIWGRMCRGFERAVVEELERQ